MRDIRGHLGMTQEQFGQDIGPLLGKPWPRQTVSLAEQGRRAFTAVELVAIAKVLGVYVGRLFTPVIDGSPMTVELSPGVQLDTKDVMETMFERMDVVAAQAALQTLIQSAQSLGTVASGIRANAQFLLDHLAGVSHDDHVTGPKRPDAAS